MATYTISTLPANSQVLKTPVQDKDPHPQHTEIFKPLNSKFDLGEIPAHECFKTRNPKPPRDVSFPVYQKSYEKNSHKRLTNPGVKSYEVRLVVKPRICKRVFREPQHFLGDQKKLGPF